MTCIKRIVSRSSTLAAYSSEELLPNEGCVLEANLKIDNAIKSVGSAIQEGVSHIFRSSNGGLTTATASAGGFYKSGPVGAVAMAVSERTIVCVNCHLGQPVYEAISGTIED